MSVPDVYLKLIPVLRPYFHQITGVVWAASWRRDIRKGIFHDSLSLIYAVGTENVSFQKPVSFGVWPGARSDCLGNLLRAVQPPAQFLGSVLVDNFDLIFTTVVVRHVFFSLALGMGSEVPDFPAQIYAGRSGQSMPQTLCSDAFSKFFGKASRAAGRVIPAPTNSDIALCATWLPFQCRLFSGGNSP